MAFEITNIPFAAENTFRTVKNLLNFGIDSCSLNDIGLTALPVSATPVKVTAYISYPTASSIKPVVA
jgi:hypothetical protein